MKEVRSIQKSFQPSPSDRAFVYQQALELDYPIAVCMIWEKNIYHVIFILDPFHKKIEVFGKGQSFIDACLKVKKKSFEKISILRNTNFSQDNYEEKSYQVDMLKYKTFIH